jgi:hypothetical protein
MDVHASISDVCMETLFELALIGMIVAGLPLVIISAVVLATFSFDRQAGEGVFDPTSQAGNTGRIHLAFGPEAENLARRFGFYTTLIALRIVFVVSLVAFVFGILYIGLS